jgi:uncharacterized protein YbjT (DUF2867 family)
MILITGAGGLNGTAIVRTFSRHGVPVRALVRDRSRAQALTILPHVEVVEGDLLRPDTYRAALDGVERALLISSADASMVEAQCAFIDACVASGVAHVVKYSGAESSIGFDPGAFRFTAMHRDVEQYLERSDMAWTHLRPSQFMHVYLRESRSIAADGTLRLPCANITLAPVDVDDIAAIAYALLREGGHVGEALAITGPEALTMTQIADAIGAAIGRPVRYVPITADERSRMLEAMGLAPFLVDGIREQTAQRLAHPDAGVSLRTHHRFGVAPTTFAAFARRHAAVFGGVAALRG